MSSEGEKYVSYKETKRKSSFGGSDIEKNDGNVTTTNLDYSNTRRKDGNNRSVKL